MVIELQQYEDLEQLLERSNTDPILIFKHSTQCPVSAAAYDEFLEFAKNAANTECGVVLVIENRSISNTIESKLGVRHESPQAIVVEKGRIRWSASHWAITSDALSKAMRS
jgi:bacillithiol system protein YtxJ